MSAEEPPMHLPWLSVLLGDPAIDKDGSSPANRSPELIVAEGAAKTSTVKCCTIPHSLAV